MNEQLAAAAAELDVLLDGGDATTALRTLCATALDLFGAAAASVAVLDGGELVYVASAGAGAEEITGVRLPLTAGIAGFVASTGQALMVGDVSRDPRFARDVAARTRYVPTTLLVTPILRDDDLVGVLSVLDRSAGADDLERADRLAGLAAALLARPRRAAGAGRALLRAAAADADDLLAGLRPDGDDGGEDELTALLAAAVGAVRAMPANRRAAAAEAVRAVLALASAGRAR